MENLVAKTAKRRNVRETKSLITPKMITEDDIRKRAFEIYLENGGNSNEFENWLRAERELKGSF